MIFKRRDKRSWGSWARDLVAPRKGWKRGVKYIGRRVQRLPDTPHRIALGFACGALISFTPFFTLHTFLAPLLAYLIGANVLAGVLGTVVGNPFTIVPIAGASLSTGNWILGREGAMASFNPLKDNFWGRVAEAPWEFLDTIFTPYLIGGVFPGLICAAICYLTLRPIVARFQDRRRDVLATRAAELVRERGSDDLAEKISGARREMRGPEAVLLPAFGRMNFALAGEARSSGAGLGAGVLPGVGWRARR